MTGIKEKTMTLDLDIYDCNRYVLFVKAAYGWDRLYSADNVSALKLYAPNMAADYRVVDRSLKRVYSLDIYPSRCVAVRVPAQEVR